AVRGADTDVARLGEAREVIAEARGHGAAEYRGLGLIGARRGKRRVATATNHDAIEIRRIARGIAEADAVEAAPEAHRHRALRRNLKAAATGVEGLERSVVDLVKVGTQTQRERIDLHQVRAVAW